MTHEVGGTEIPVLLTGIGGQGVQLAAQVMGRAALAEGRDVQLFGSYGGMMRGGNTDATVVIAERAVESPPTVVDAWAGLLLHHEHAAGVLDRVRPGGIVLLNSSVWVGGPVRGELQILEVPATAIAADAGDPIAAAMVLLGAFAAATGIVKLASLQGAAVAALPAYRRHHVALNERALASGHGAVPSPIVEAWSNERAGSAR